jgi:hypothetical protein
MSTPWVCSRARRMLAVWSWHGHTRARAWHGGYLFKGKGAR